MKPEQLQDALNEIKDEYITDAHKEKSVTESTSVGGSAKQCKKARSLWKHQPFRIALVTAACLILLAGGALFARQLGKKLQPSPGSADGVYIPPSTIRPSATADMIGLICHNGKVFTETEKFSSDVKEDIWGMVGTYLGEANGEIYEWTAQQNENWITELASTTGGAVYTVNGYDDNFRICTAGEWYPDEGGVRYFVYFYECLNDITLTTGSDLIDQKLRITEQLPDTIEPETKTLLQALCDAPFISLEPDEASGHYYYGDKEKDFRYMKDYCIYLSIPLNDSTACRFVVYKNGYVRYDCFDLRNCYMTVDPALVEYLFQ